MNLEFTVYNISCLIVTYNILLCSLQYVLLLQGLTYLLFSHWSWLQHFSNINIHCVPLELPSWIQILPLPLCCHFIIALHYTGCQLLNNYVRNLKHHFPQVFPPPELVEQFYYCDMISIP